MPDGPAGEDERGLLLVGLWTHEWRHQTLAALAQNLFELERCGSSLEKDIDVGFFVLFFGRMMLAKTETMWQCELKRWTRGLCVADLGAVPSACAGVYAVQWLTRGWRSVGAVCLCSEERFIIDWGSPDSWHVVIIKSRTILFSLLLMFKFPTDSVSFMPPPGRGLLPPSPPHAP